MSFVNPVFLLFGGLAVLAMVPLIIALLRVRTPRGRRASALALHRAQLEELDRELEAGRIGSAEHEGAKLEVQRRLLAVADLQDEGVKSASKGPLILACILVPLAAEGLYLVGGHPELPSGIQERHENAAQDEVETERLISTLRSRLGDLDPATDIASQGYVLLGNAEASRGRIGEAAAAWKMALQGGFNPALAAQAADAQLKADGVMRPETRALFERALAEAPPDAAWKAIVKQKLSESK
jgi:cytochrome c-type biogenesis protein CcmH